MVVKSVVRLDKVKSVYGGNTFSCRTADIVENGFVGHLGAVEAANRDIHALVKPLTATLVDSLVLIANPAMIYDNARLGTGLENLYQMEIGEAVRAYEIQKYDTFAVSREGITTLAVGGAAVAGNYVIAANASYKLTEITKAAYDALVTKPAFSAKIIREDVVGGLAALNGTQTPTTYVVVEVLAN